MQKTDSMFAEADGNVILPFGVVVSLFVQF